MKTTLRTESAQHRRSQPTALVIQEGKTYSVAQLRNATSVAVGPNTHFKLALPAGTWSVQSMSSRQLQFEPTMKGNKQVLEVTVGEANKLMASESFWLQMIRTDKVDRRDVSFGVYYRDPYTETQRLVLGRDSQGELRFADGKRPRPSVGSGPS